MRKVVTGEKFSVKAKTWNSFIDAAVYVKQRQADLSSKTPRRDTKSGVVLVRNSTDEDLGQFAVVALGALIITPSDNEQDFRNNLPIFEAEAVSDENLDKVMVILQKPIKKNEVGTVMLSGITPAKINIENEDHEFAEVTEDGLKSSSNGRLRVLWKEEEEGEDKWAIILLGSSGAGDTYDGYFKAVNSSDENTQKVKITFGYALINDSLFSVIDNSLTDEDDNTFAGEVEVTGQTYIYLQATYNTDTETISEPTIEQSTNFPLPEDNMFKGLIAVVKWDGENGKISKIIQQHYGVMYGIILGAC
jgi:hypothetical protein